MPNLTRYDPFSLSRMDPFESLMRDFLPTTYRSMLRTVNEPNLPIEVRERDDAYLLTAEIPGVKKQDIDISITGNQLTISFEVKQESLPAELKEWCNERWYGKFSRTVHLPHEIEEKGADASYADGLLHLTLPKKASSVSRRLVIH